MKTIELSGIIKFEYDNWDKLKLVQKDGYKIDLVNRIKGFGNRIKPACYK